MAYARIIYFLLALVIGVAASVQALAFGAAQDHACCPEMAGDTGYMDTMSSPHKDDACGIMAADACQGGCCGLMAPVAVLSLSDMAGLEGLAQEPPVLHAGWPELETSGLDKPPPR